MHLEGTSILQGLATVSSAPSESMGPPADGAWAALALIGVRLGSVPRAAGTAAVFPLVVTLEEALQHFKSSRLQGPGADFQRVFPLTFHISQTGLCASSQMGLKFDSCFFFFSLVVVRSIKIAPYPVKTVLFVIPVSVAKYIPAAVGGAKLFGLSWPHRTAGEEFPCWGGKTSTPSGDS